LWSGKGSIGLRFPETDAEIVTYSDPSIPSSVEVYCLVDGVIAAVDSLLSEGCHPLVTPFLRALERAGCGKICREKVSGGNRGADTITSVSDQIFEFSQRLNRFAAPLLPNTQLACNRTEDHELSMLSLHLLQNCMVYINTLMMHQVLSRPHWAERLTTTDLGALTPLIWEHVNPYGCFGLNMETRLDLSRNGV
jgi:Tn3 transposase DDE domain